MNKKVQKRNRKGFTLIELVVVVAIIGILAAIAIPRYMAAQERARESAHAANLATLKSAANVALADNGPPAGLVTWTETNNGTSPHLRDSYVDQWPTDPWRTGDDAQSYQVTITAEGVITVTGPQDPTPHSEPTTP